ncbi:MAG: peptidoglycan DD-metalloendopeptidase family protein [Kineosporiaceae bacterium]
MSSHDRDHLLAEGSAVRKTSGQRRPTSGSTGRRTAARTEEKAGDRVPAQRRSASTQAAKPATAKSAAPKGAAARPVATEAVAVKRTPPTTTAARSGSAKPAAAAKATVSKATVAKPAATKTTPAKPAAAKPAAAQAAPAKPAAADPTAKSRENGTRPRPTPRPRPAAATGTRPRPTPRPRPAASAAEPVVEVATVEDAAALVAVEEARSLTVLQEVASGDAALEHAVFEHGRHRAPARRAVPASLRRLVRFLPPAKQRRPAVYVAAALTGALGLGLLTAGSSDAQAAGVSPSASVARELGVSSHRQALAGSPAPRPLEDMVASRAQREAQQTAAAQTQDQADQQALAAAAEAARPKAVMPINGATMTTCFCMRWGVMHEGIDLAAPFGTPEYAAMDGIVLKAGPASGFGQAVYIQHANGDVTIYGHMEKILVTEGQVVRAGDTIALEGAEGQSTGPHLHFEVHQGGINGSPIDPVSWLRQFGVAV